MKVTWRSRRWTVGLAAVLLGAGVACVPRSDQAVRLVASFWSPPAIEERIARDFEARHPETSVQLILTGGRYAEKVQSMIVADNPPDVIMVTTAFFHDWAARGVLADVTDLVGELDAEEAFASGPKEAFRFRGRYLAVPITFDALVTIANVEALTAVGFELPDESFTWADLESWGPRLSRLAGAPDAPTDYLCALPPPEYFIVAFGVRVFDDPERPGAVVIDAALAEDAFDYWRRMHQRGWAVDRGTVLDQGETEMFRDGRVAITFWGRGVAPILQAKSALRWDIAPLPAGPAGRTVPFLAGGVGISRTTRRPEAARAYLRYYASAAANRILVESGRGLPMRTTGEGARMIAAMDSPPSAFRYAETLAAGATTALVQAPGGMAVEEIVRRRFEQALAMPDIPSSRIVAGLIDDLSGWLATTKERAL